MIYNKLANSDIKISKLGFGTWALSKTGWKDVNQDEAIKCLEKAYEYGINFFDTAPIYGFGKAEEIIGEVLHSIRDKIIIASKFGLIWDNYKTIKHDLSKDSIMYEIETSLKRLKTDYIDLYQVHWPDKKTSFNDVFNSLNLLKKQGVIKNIGVSNFNLDELKTASSICNISSIQNRFNLLQNEDLESIIPFCIENNISYIGYSPLAQGLLSGKIKRDYKTDKKDIRRFNPLFKDNKVFDIIDTLEKPILKTSLKYLMDTKGLSSFLISITKLKHFEENINLFNELSK